MASVTTIIDNTLLEHSPEEYVISAAEWNAVMSTIKNAINNNASVLLSSGATFSCYIYNSANAAFGASWQLEDASEDPHKFVARIDLPSAMKNTPVIVYTFAAHGNTPVSCKYEKTMDGGIVFESRVDQAIKVVLQGVKV